jgi:cephalosporin-C deacetylase-like acetyl esterase
VEPQFQAEPEATLYCTPNGSLRYSQQGLTIYSLMLKKQQQLPPPRKLPSGAARLAALRAEMLDQIRKLLRYRQAGSPLEVRLLETTPRKGYQLEKLEFVSEPGIYVPTWVFIPEKRNSRAPAILYVHEAGKEKLGQESGLFEKLTLAGGLVIAVDVRRLRATGSSEDSKVKGFGHLFNAETALAYMTWFMDECLFGMRVQDVVRSVEYALSREDVNQKNLRVVGKGAGALWVLYAAALDPRISDVVADGGLVSYRSLAQVDRYLHGAHLFIRDVLLHFDLPQVAATVANRKLALVSPVDPMMKPLSAAAARQAYRWTAEIYARAGAAGHFRILTRALDLLAPA